MILLTLIFVPLLGVFMIHTDVLSSLYNSKNSISTDNLLNNRSAKITGLSVSIINLLVSLVTFILFDFSTNQYQFVQEHHEWSSFHIYLGIDGLSMYFVLLTTIITPVALLSN